MSKIKIIREFRKAKINDKWCDAEITKKTKDLLDSMGIHIT
ncbi:MAG: hypothetical protein V1779_05070 [bacterium]